MPDPVDPQQGAVEDHERLAGCDLDRLLQRGRHRREERKRPREVAVRRRGANPDLLLRIAVDRGIAFGPRPAAMDVALPWLAHCVDLLVAQLPQPQPQPRQWLAAALTALAHEVQMSTLADPLPLERRLIVALAVIASPRGAQRIERRLRRGRWWSRPGSGHHRRAQAGSGTRSV
jgi:hypothetical protein